MCTMFCTEVDLRWQNREISLKTEANGPRFAVHDEE